MKKYKYYYTEHKNMQRFLENHIHAVNPSYTGINPVICQGTSDINYVYRAVITKDIRPFREYKFDYPSLAEFYIHKLLLDLQHEFYLYDIRTYPVYLWFTKRLPNIMNRINQIRQRDFYFNALTI